MAPSPFPRRHLLRRCGWGRSECVSLPKLETPPTPERSRIMSLVRGRDTRPEMEVRKSLFRAGFRYRVHVTSLPGKPDLVLPRYKAVIFVHGCFWHGHSCARGTRRPRSNRGYWEAKLARNIARDQSARDRLEADGWRTFVIWECSVARSVDELIAILRATTPH
jgi:DNA mismatch endonuclease (patch repair protein)